jgi:hypothetical protein
MGYSVFPAPAAGSKTMYRTTLTSGTSWTVPTGVTYVNVTLYGAGGGGGNYNGSSKSEVFSAIGLTGNCISSTLSCTPGASIAYAIGAGGAGAGGGGNYGGNGDTGGTTTFTGATSAAGGTGGRGFSATTGGNGSVGMGSSGGSQSYGGVQAAGSGGNGKIDIEYWV